MSKSKPFVTVHSHPMSLDSGSTPESFIERELELETGYITVTDHGTLQAARKIYDLAHKAGIKPILGAEIYFRDDNDPILKSFGIPKDEDGTYRNYWKYGHATLHFKDQAAFECGSRLISEADVTAERHGSQRKPIMGWAQIEELAQYNITMSSGCLIGVCQRHLLDHNRLDIAEAYYKRFREVVGVGRWMAEVFPHVCSTNWVHGVFITLADGSKQKYHMQKNFRTNEGEIQAEALAGEFNKKNNKHVELRAIKNYSSWDDIKPQEIVAVERVEGFQPNECRPWAPTGDVQAGCNKAILYLSKKYSDLVVIGDDSHYANQKDYVVQNVRLSQSGNWRFTSGYHRQSSEEAWKYFNEVLYIPQNTFESWVDNSRAWAEGFNDFKFDYKPTLPTKFYPENTLAHLITLVKKHGRLDADNPVYVDRLKTEIKLLHENGTIDLLPYFFIAEEATSVYSDAGVLIGPGRGSAAGLLTAYLLGITHVDPIKHGLSLDRFLTLDRIKSGRLPDIDIDFNNRDLLTDAGGWLETRFGDHFAQISVSTTLRLRMAVKDTARMTFGHVPPDIEAWCKRFAMPPQGVSDIDFIMGYMSEEGVEKKGSITYDKALIEYVAKYPKQWEIVQQALGLNRSNGRHASAFAIANRPIKEFIPTTSVNDVTVTQYTADSVEASGAIKMDFLVVSAIKDIGDCIKLIQSRRAVEGLPPKNWKINGRLVPNHRILPFGDGIYDIWDLPTDQAVFNDIALGETETVFQMNTPGAVQWLAHFNHNKADGTPILDSVRAMATFTALDRPGPLDAFVVDPEDTDIEEKGMIKRRRHNMLVEYTRRARGLEPSPEVLPFFAKLLPETFGVLVFQEQVEAVYKSLTGCTGAQAEAFRSDVAKKKKAKIEAAYPFFLEHASEKLGKENAEAAWQFLITFAAYGFNACVTGDTVVIRAGANDHCTPQVTIKELFAAQNSGTPWGQKIRAGKLNIAQMDEDSRVRTGRLRKIHLNGKKEVFRIKTKGGAAIKVTGNHRLLTDNGYREASNLAIGNKLVVVDNTIPPPPKKQTTRAIGKSYDGCGMPIGSENPSWIDGRTAKFREACALVSARSNGRCESCGAISDGTSHFLEFAHQLPLVECNGDYSLYHSSDNIRHLCNPCHKTLDYKKGERVKRWRKGLPTKTDEIVSITPAGIENVFDIEMSTVGHNFIANGIVSHNSHAICYATTAYACAFLKHYYPLEWWCSVLRNADKNEVNETFWKYAGHLIDLPDVKLSGPYFEIQGDRIRAPLDLLKGVGETAHAQICAGRPYVDIEDFCQKIEAHKKKTGKMVKKTKTIKATKTKPESKVEVEVFSSGRSAISDKIVQILIISGAMDSLFPKTQVESDGSVSELTAIDYIKIYRETMERVSGRKKKYIEPGQGLLTPLVRYQTKKTVLPAYSECLQKYLPRDRRFNVRQGRTYFEWEQEVRIVSAEEYHRLEQIDPFTMSMTYAVVGYVNAARAFQYGPDKEKKACEVQVDVNGTVIKAVKWPRKNKIPSAFSSDLTGAIVVLVLTKYDKEKPSVIEDIVIVQPPLDQGEDSAE